MHQGSPLVPLFHELWCSLHRSPTAALGHLHAILTSVLALPSLHLHSPIVTLLDIHSRHIPKPSQYSLIRSTLQANFSNTSSREHLLSFSQHFSTPCLCSVQCCWNNFSFIWILTVLRNYSRSSIAQHTVQLSPPSIPNSISVPQPCTTSIRCQLRPHLFKIIQFLLRLAI